MQLLLTIMPGLPRAVIRSVSSHSTQLPEIEAAGTSAGWAVPERGRRPGANRTFAAFAPPHTQAFFAALPMGLLAVDRDAFAPQQDVRRR